MTDGKHTRTRKLAHEVLGLLLTALLLSLVVLWLVSLCSEAAAWLWLENQGLVLTDMQLIRFNSWLFGLSLLAAVVFFVLLFLFLLGERLSYITQILGGIELLQRGQMGLRIPLQGRNELTQLAEAVNYLSASQLRLQEQEQTLHLEREQLIRTLCHDIRTPLTSILSCSEFLAGHEEASPEQRGEYLTLIHRKAQQIRELTALLMEERTDTPEWFADGRLLMEQLCGAFSEMLEDDFALTVELDSLPPFSGSFVLGELQRIFDNLASNIRKYAHPDHPVVLTISHRAPGPLVIAQRNHCRPDGDTAESHGLGLLSIRRIAHRWGGRVETRREGELFSIVVELSEF